MKNFTFKSFLKLIFSSLTYFLLNNIAEDIPLSLSAFTGFLSVSFNPICQIIVFFAVSLFSFSFTKCLLLLPGTAILSVIFYIYKSKKRKPAFELLIYFAVALLPYIFGNFKGEIIEKLGYSAIIYSLAVILTATLNILFIKKFKSKNNIFEQISLYISIVVLSLGAIKLTGVFLWQQAALVILLFMCLFYKNSKAFIPAFLLPIALCIYTKNLTYLAIFQIYCASILIFINISTLLSAMGLVFCQFGIYYLQGILPTLGVFEYIFTFIPSVIFLFIPNNLVEKAKKFFTRFDEPQMTTHIINTERGEISARLANLATSFCDLENATSSLDEIYPTKESIIDKMTEEVIVNICGECNMQQSCAQKNNIYISDIKKLISLGVSKGKVSIIDLSRDFSSYCYSTNAIMCEINKLILSYKNEVEKIESTQNFKKMVSIEASGIHEVLNSLSFEFSKRINFDEKKRSQLFNSLAINSFFPRNIILTGEEVHLLFDRCNIDYGQVANVISQCLNRKLTLFTKTDVGDGILSVFKNAPKFDASFGISQVIKDNSSASGDTHSLVRINQGKFMIALCDGMGSGENAYKNSKTTISLIEGFYKSQLSNKKTIEIANKMLSICSEDSFSALDMASFDLFDGTLSTFKIGATYGFLIKKKSIILIENNSLPIGILDDVSPSSKTLKIDDGDMLVLCSDGITDAFFSSSDFIDFLKTQSTKNPQYLADNILNYALSLNKGKALDDMTSIVVRIYKK